MPHAAVVHYRINADTYKKLNEFESVGVTYLTLPEKIDTQFLTKASTRESS